MVVFLRSTTVAVFLLLVAGCVTDELATYPDSVVNKKAMIPFLGMYQVAAWPGDAKPEAIQVTEEDGKFSFSYALGDQKIHANFVLSKIPKSEKGLYLLSLPAQQGTDQANMFFIGKADKDQTSIWVVFANLPVAKDHLSFAGGMAKAEDVKRFLATHADAFVTANQPQVTLKKEQR